MATVHAMVSLPLTPQQVWQSAIRLEETPEWLVLLEGWRGRLPDHLGVGAKVSGIVVAKGFRNRTEWVCTTYDEPRALGLTGTGIAGTKYGLNVMVVPSAGGCDVDVAITLGGPPLFGPIGKIVALALRKDIDRSAQNFRDRYSVPAE